MLRKIVSGIMLAMLLTSILASAFNIQQVEASGNIYLRADGSVDPPTAPIQRSGAVYTFTSNISGRIIDERDNIVIDGAGYTLRSTLLTTPGVDLSQRTNVTVKNTRITLFEVGIYLHNSSGNTLFNNTIELQDRTWNGDLGIFLSENSTNNILSTNNIKTCFRGILLQWSSSSNILTNNNITDSYTGIHLQSSDGNTLSYNSLTDIGEGINVYYSSFNTLSNNNVLSIVSGIHLYSTSYFNSLSDNTITNSGSDAIFLEFGPSNNTLSGNTVTSNENGIKLQGAVSEYTANNALSGNTVANNYYGIYLSSAPNTTIFNNLIENNTRGIYLQGPSSLPSSLIYHNNFINNTYKPYATYSNTWDDGYPSGGNYWSDYTGVDTNGDGIGDTPYVIDENNQDRYPLVSPWIPTPGKKPVVILLHGFQSDEYNPDNIWSNMKSGLARSCTVYVSHYAFDVATALSIKQYAGNLENEIKQIMQEEGVDKVDIIAHSMGGLVARYYIEMGNGFKHVRKLIMLETPNQGCNSLLLPLVLALGLAGVDPQVNELLTSLKFALLGIPLPPKVQAALTLGSVSAKIVSYLSSYLGTVLEMMKCWDCVKEMSSNNEFLKILNSNYVLNFKNKVDYSSLGGWLYEIPWLKAFDLDGVSKETVSGIDDLILGYHGHLPENPKIIQRIREILLYNSLGSAGIYASENNAENDVETQWTISIPGGISPGEERLHEIPINSATAANFILAGSVGDLNLTLITPNGTLIAPSFGGYYSDENRTTEGYIIANLETGIWNANVMALDALEEQSYMIMVMLDSNVTLSAPLSKHQYNPGEPINITASLNSNNQAVTNGSVRVKIERPDGTIGNITLFDDGLHGDNLANDGLYSNMYTNSSLWGTYEITVTANGTIDGAQFSRESYAKVWVEQYPDLTLNESDIDFSVETPLEGETIIINATIHNIGEIDACNASILFYDGSPAEGSLIGEDIANITLGASATLSIQWNATSGQHQICVLVSPFNRFLEADYFNNSANKTMEVRIAGDVNGDGKVEVHDLFDFGKAYGCTSDDPNWNRNCDFNFDNIINAVDLERLQKNYGKINP